MTCMTQSFPYSGYGEDMAGRSTIPTVDGSDDVENFHTLFPK
jgi:hypothetical protein